MDLQSIEAGVENNLISLEDTEVANFCDIWPNAKAGLEILVNVIKNPIVKLIIKAVIAAGNSIHTARCPND